MAKPAPPAASEAPLLLERERELDVLRGALDRLGEGVGSMVLVEGPAGIGKTRLLAEAAGFARQREFTVRSARGGQLERQMPFGIARQLFEPVIERASDQERDRLFAGSAELALSALGREDPKRAGPVADPFAPIHGLYWLLANLAEDRPVALVIDDAHWADAQTLRFLDYLARRLQDTPVVVVAGVRSGEPDEPPEIEPLRLEAELVQPGPLSGQAVRELIAAELEAQPAPEFSAVCAQVTAGNPFLLAEVLRTIRADAIEPDPQAAAAIAELGPESVARYVLMRLGRFGDDAVALARAIAVLGGSPQLRHAAALADLDEDRAHELCDRLREAEILAPGLPIEFVHPLVRSAIYSDLAEGERSAAHRRAARLLHKRGAAVRDIGPHLLACYPEGDQWVVSKLGEAAGDAVAQGGFDSAAVYLGRALAEPPDDDLPLRFVLGTCMIQTDLGRAKEVLAEVAERASDDRLRLRASKFAGIASFAAGDWPAAAGWLAAAADAVPETERESRLAAEAHLYCASVLARGHRREDSQRIEAAAADAVGDGWGKRLASQALALDRFLSCAPASDVIEMAGRFPPQPWRTTPIIMPTPGVAVKVLAWSGGWTQGREASQAMVSWSRAGARLVAESYSRTFLSDLERHAGALADAETEARTAWRIATEVAPDSDFALHAMTNLLAALLERGELAEAARFSESMDLSSGMEIGGISPWPLEIRGYLSLARGDLQGGVKDLLEVGNQAEARGFRNPAFSAWRQQVAPALAALGNAAEAEEVIEVADERARRFGAPHVIGTVMRARGLIEPRKRQIETLRKSVSCLEEYGPPHELARSLLELGAALRRHGHRAESRDPLRRALELGHRCGAGGTEARAREELGAAGARPRSVFRTGVDALTASELRVAKLAADGLSNVEIAQRLFVTRKTVEKHLSNAYMKLDISGRAELSVALEDSTAS